MAITYRDDVAVDVGMFRDILERSTLARRRPVDEPDRLAKMLAAYTFVITAWDGDRLVGLATVWTDYAYTAYLADLAVDATYQKTGVGRRLVERSREKAGNQVTLLLLAAPDAAAYYPKIGMERFTDCFLFRRLR